MRERERDRQTEGDRERETEGDRARDKGRGKRETKKKREREEKETRDHFILVVPLNQSKEQAQKRTQDGWKKIRAEQEVGSNMETDC